MYAISFELVTKVLEKDIKKTTEIAHKKGGTWSRRFGGSSTFKKSKTLFD
jgi:virulence-associated protein VapD